MITQIKYKFGDRVDIFKKNSRRYYVKIEREYIRDIIAFMVNDLKIRFSIVSGVDAEAGIELLYHLMPDKENMIITVKTVVPKTDPKINTVSDIIEAAEWIEREVHEMLGIDFIGHPNLKRLLLADDWPADQYPLRKDFKSA